MNRSFQMLFVILICAMQSIAAVMIDHVEPPFWWTGMKDHRLQLLINGDGVGKMIPVLTYPGVKITGYKGSGKNYLFVDLEIGKQTIPGKFVIGFSIEGKIVESYSYELRKKDTGKGKHEGFGTADAIYLVMPDRFSNGDTTNDNMPGMLEQANCINKDGRHGGDLAGISTHLDYIHDLGFTALWINPVLENNMPKFSYHGYAITDFYKVDPRFGTNEDYVALIKKARGMGIKVIMDMVFNHCGSYHWWMKDLPQADWINEWPEFTRSNYRAGVVADPYASGYDKKQMLEGWFDVTMPDMNQKNPYLANYLIQNGLWWIEYAGLDGIRMDTYPYSDQEFMDVWMKRVLEEYPDFNVVGEVWMSASPQVGWWLHHPGMKSGNGKTKRYASHLTNVFDFPLTFTLQQALTEDDGWSTGMAKLYELLSQDFVYSEPNDLVVFADNHDIDRMMSKLKTTANVKMAMAFLCTTRGFPLFYYGSEILMKGWADEGHGTIRRDFPGGWTGDTINVFTQTKLDKEQVEVYTYLKRILNWRKGNETVQKGKLTHYIPEKGVYVYFRTLGKSSVMIIMNNSKEDQIINTGRYSENLKSYTRGLDITDQQWISDLKSIHIQGKSARIIELSTE